MKAAVLHQLGSNPKYEDFQAPIPVGEDQVLVKVKASSLKQLDKGKAAGIHYTQYPYLPIVVGVDGIGALEDGTLVYAQGLSGMFAEKALIQKGTYTVVPKDVDLIKAAALPNALLGSDLALMNRGGMKKGAVVLVNGATGFTGKVAVQMAKYRGASKVIVTGRNAAVLEELKSLGADEVIVLSQTDEEVIQQFKTIQKEHPIDIVLDYLWGHTVELILRALNECPPKKVRIVSIGQMAGAEINLPSGFLRSRPIELVGSGFGGIPMKDISDYMINELPQLFALLAEDKLKVDVEVHNLKDIESVWTKKEASGRRIVIQTS